ncbi:hypothetical protein CF160_05935 [Enterococcus pseudoavium]|nr:hypothetical protein CF160_05935 [Enterococcus pseudoavium]
MPIQVWLFNIFKQADENLDFRKKDCGKSGQLQEISAYFRKSDFENTIYSEKRKVWQESHLPLFSLFVENTIPRMENSKFINRNRKFTCYLIIIQLS